MTPTDGALKWLVPICEMTRQIGVHLVTLRAWERRYGLIEPKRSSKGHRLYTSHIAQIRAVLGWLEHGMAVGQVKRLLDEPKALAGSNYDHWCEQQRLWLECLATLSDARFDERVNEFTVLYLAATLSRQLLQPFLTQLNQHAAHSCDPRLEQVYLLTRLCSRLAHTPLQSIDVLQRLSWAKCPAGEA